MKIKTVLIFSLIFLVCDVSAQQKADTNQILQSGKADHNINKNSVNKNTGVSTGPLLKRKRSVAKGKNSAGKKIKKDSVKAMNDPMTKMEFHSDTSKMNKAPRDKKFNLKRQRKK